MAARTYNVWSEARDMTGELSGLELNCSGTSGKV